MKYGVEILPVILKNTMQTNNPKISVITVAYNAARVIEKTIQSVINQTYSNIEYIIIDGGSRDGTLDIIKKYEDRISYWISEPDKGIYEAMNKGIIRATGDWINFINSGDSLVNKEVIDQFIGLHDTNADIIYGDTMNSIEEMDISYIQKPALIESIESKMVFGHPSSFVKAKLMKDALFDTTFRSSADYNFFLHCYRSNRIFQYIPITVAVFDYDTGISSNFKINRHEKARIHGVEHKFSWKVQYAVEYIIWKFRYWIKKNLPRNIVKKYYLRKFDKYKNIIPEGNKLI